MWIDTLRYGVYGCGKGFDVLPVSISGTVVTERENLVGRTERPRHPNAVGNMHEVKRNETY